MIMYPTTVDMALYCAGMPTFYQSNTSSAARYVNFYFVHDIFLQAKCTWPLNSSFDGIYIISSVHVWCVYNLQPFSLPTLSQLPLVLYWLRCWQLRPCWVSFSDCTALECYIHSSGYLCLLLCWCDRRHTTYMVVERMLQPLHYVC